MDSNEITLHCACAKYYRLGRELNKCKLTVSAIVFEVIIFLAQHFDATLTCGSERAFRKRALSFFELAAGGGGQQWPENLSVFK